MSRPKGGDNPQFDWVVEQINAQSPVWQNRLGLDHYHIDHKFLDVFYEDDHAVTATTHSQWQYLTAEIHWYLPSAVRSNPQRLEEILVHELTHVLLSPEQTLIDERLTQHNADNPQTEHEYTALQTAYYERLELTTEQVTRALHKAWNQ